MDYYCEQEKQKVLVTVFYYNSTCVLKEIIYDRTFSFSLFQIITYIILYIFIISVFIFIFLTIKYVLRLRNLLNPERNALIAIHPDGYWNTLVQENNPFRNMFR
jgi:hypothetical protein